MSFYFYYNHPNRKVTIHKGDCGHCKEGIGPHINIQGNVNGGWSQHHISYEIAFKEAKDIADNYKYTLRDCGVCKPTK